MPRERDPQPKELNMLFEPGNIARTKSEFQKQFGSNYRVGDLAGLISGMAPDRVDSWRSHLANDVPASITEAVRAIVLHALDGDGDPVPLSYSWTAAKSFKLTIIEDPKSGIKLEAEGPLP